MIHHYTSIENLALILKYRTIRFSRLDILDDINEISGLTRKFGTYVFVSCWTEDEFENIALWNMYTQMKGVRISLPNNMFKKHLIKAGDYGNYGWSEDIDSPLPLDKIITDQYFISNPFWLPDGFYKKVMYDKNYKTLNRTLIEETPQGIILKGLQKLGNYKDPIWEFQKESRFTLVAFPLLPLNHPMILNKRENQMSYITNGILNDIENSFTYIDIELDKEIVNNISIRLAPLCTESDEIIINSLLREYTTSGILNQSHLKGSIRKK